MSLESLTSNQRFESGRSGTGLSSTHLTNTPMGRYHGGGKGGGNFGLKQLNVLQIMNPPINTSKVTNGPAAAYRKNRPYNSNSNLAGINRNSLNLQFNNFGGSSSSLLNSKIFNRIDAYPYIDVIKLVRDRDMVPTVGGTPLLSPANLAIINNFLSNSISKLDISNASINSTITNVLTSFITIAQSGDVATVLLNNMYSLLSTIYPNAARQLLDTSKILATGAQGDTTQIDTTTLNDYDTSSSNVSSEESTAANNYLLSFQTDLQTIQENDSKGTLISIAYKKEFVSHILKAIKNTVETNKGTISTDLVTKFESKIEETKASINSLEKSISGDISGDITSLQSHITTFESRVKSLSEYLFELTALSDIIASITTISKSEVSILSTLSGLFNKLGKLVLKAQVVEILYNDEPIQTLISNIVKDLETVRTTLSSKKGNIRNDNIENALEDLMNNASSRIITAFNSLKDDGKKLIESYIRVSGISNIVSGTINSLSKILTDIINELGNNTEPGSHLNAQKIVLISGLMDLTQAVTSCIGSSAHTLGALITDLGEVVSSIEVTPIATIFNNALTFLTDIISLLNSRPEDIKEALKSILPKLTEGVLAAEILTYLNSNRTGVVGVMLLILVLMTDTNLPSEISKICKTFLKEKSLVKFLGILPDPADPGGSLDDIITNINTAVDNLPSDSLQNFNQATSIVDVFIVNNLCSKLGERTFGMLKPNINITPDGTIIKAYHLRKVAQNVSWSQGNSINNLQSSDISELVILVAVAAVLFSVASDTNLVLIKALSLRQLIIKDTGQANPVEYILKYFTREIDSLLNDIKNLSTDDVTNLLDTFNAKLKIADPNIGTKFDIPQSVVAFQILRNLMSELSGTAQAFIDNIFVSFGVIVSQLVATLFEVFFLRYAKTDLVQFQPGKDVDQAYNAIVQFSSSYTVGQLQSSLIAEFQLIQQDISTDRPIAVIHQKINIKINKEINEEYQSGALSYASP